MTNKLLSRILCVAAIGLMLAGCTGANDIPEKTSQEATTEMENQLTMEYITSHSELTAADFENVDFDAFVAMYQLTEENVHEYYLPDLIYLYHWEISRGNAVDYTYIYTAADGQLTDTDIDQIDVLLLEYHEGTDNHYLIVDFAAGKAYQSRHEIISSCREQDKTADLLEKDRIFVSEALRDSGITGWENEYIGTNEGTTGSFSWAIGIKLRDGRCVKYHGYGVLDSGTPIEFFSLQESLLEHFA